MSPHVDAIELLLPRAAPPLAERARRVTTFLRLLAADARPAPAGRVSVDLDRARSVFERESARTCAALLLDLLRHHLTAALGPDSFCWVGATRNTASEAWSALELLRDEWPWLPQVPGPGERALGVGERLLQGLERLAPVGLDLPLWRARLVRAEAGPAAGEARFEELLDADGAGAGSERLCGLLECQLDGGGVQRAHAELAERAPEAGESRRLEQLRSWVQLLRGEDLRATPAPTNSGTPGTPGTPQEPRQPSSGSRAAPLPTALAELRECRPEWLGLLRGARSGAAGPGDRRAESFSRSAVGAAFLGVFILEPGGSPRPVHTELAPALEGRLSRWLEDRDGACAQSSEPEHRLVVEARSVVSHRHAMAPLRGALAPEQARALALEPILDEAGEVAGWLHLELAHHLLPTSRWLRAAARTWAARVLPPAGAQEAARTAGAGRGTTRVSGLAARVGAARPGGPGGLRGPGSIGAMGAPGDTERSARAAHPADHPQSEVFRTAVETLGMKTHLRRWWGFEVRDAEARCVAEGGAGLAAASRTGLAHGLGRALRSGGLVRFEDPDERLSIHADAASGVCLPLFCRGTLCGLLAVESSRRRDFGDSLVERLTARGRELGIELRTAQFREHHLQLFGHDVHFAPSRQVDELLLASRARAPIAIWGPEGVGKRIVARWVHFESERHEHSLVAHSCGFERGGEFPTRELLELAAEGTLLLHDVERLSESHQVGLAAYLAGSDRVAVEPGPRVIATSHRSPAEGVRAGVLRPDLCRRLERLVLAVPALAAQRDAIPGLVALLCRRFAAEEGVAAPRLEDAAQACLWRQSWPGNVRQLENAVFKLVITAAGGAVDAGRAEAVLNASLGECLRRVPSRRPDRATVLSALRVTRTGRGSLNKTRASLYLGWDPDTLVLRMAELGIEAGRGGINPGADPAGSGSEAARDR